MKNFKSIKRFTLMALVGLLVAVSGCQKGNLIDNPNVAGAGSLVPVPLILNHLTSTFIKSAEVPFGDANKYDQFIVANYAYYRGSNNYSSGFTNTVDSYDIIKYAIALQQQSTAQLNTQNNVYYAMGQFFKAYAGVWLTQRVGDIPFSSVNGNTTNLTPVYDTQHDVYKKCLALLDSANTTFNNLYATGNTTLKISPSALLSSSGDIFGLTNLQWQKVINTFRLRVLMSLSKRAIDPDAADLNINTSFNTIVTNPATYPVMTGNADNLVYKFNSATNPYPLFSLGYNPYNNFANVGNTYLSITTANLDPRTYVVATPAPAQIVTNNKQLNDFTAYVGADGDLAQAALLANSNTFQYSFSNYSKYYTDKSGATQEPFIFIGYPELCFTIAEGIQRGWTTGTTATWYNNGINASLANYGVTDGKVLTINYPVALNTPFVSTSVAQGAVWGTVTVNLAPFNAKVAYLGDANPGALAQILNQKYVAFFNNSGWQAYFDWRRTGYPTAFAGTGGSGIGTPTGAIPRRFLYPQSEVTYNPANNAAALVAQFGGVDDITKDVWAVK